MNGLGWPDYLVLFAYFAAIIAMAAYFSRRQKSTEVYFLGGRSVPWWAMGMSMLATLISSITFVAYPGEGYGKNWSGLVPGLMVPVVLLLMGFVIVPFYREAVGMSAYEYFEKRFGYLARLYSSLSFSLVHFTKMAFVFWLIALALSSMTGWDLYTLICALGILTVVYTLVGGIEAVIWSDVIQGTVLTLGGLVALGILLFTPSGGPEAVVALAWENQKISLGSFDVDLANRTFVVLALYGFFTYVQKYAADQTIVQRYLVAKSHREAIKGTMLGALLCIPVWALFLLIGSCVWSFYQIEGTVLPDHIQKADQVFPYFVMHELPAGLTGLILAALIAAAMSSLDSDLNCLSAVVVEDYFKRAKPAATDRQCLVVGKLTVVAAGAASVSIALALATTEGTALSLAFLISSIVSGGLAGLFFLAFLSYRANARGAYIGILACILFTAWATLTSKKTVNWGDFNFPLHGYMIGVLNNIVLLVFGYLGSLLFPAEERTREMTLWGWLEKRRQHG